MQLIDFCRENDYRLYQEYRFHEKRAFRFDWAILEVKIAVEYNGIICKKSRHTTITGYSNDMKKINLAQTEGWKVFQFTPLNYKTIFETLNEMI